MYVIQTNLVCLKTYINSQSAQLFISFNQGLAYCAVEKVMRLLIIDDDSELATKTRQNLATHFVVDCVDNFDEGLIQACTGLYQVILIALNIKSFSGLHLIKLIRAEKITAPILAVSESCSSQDVAEIYNGGSDDLLIRPFSYSELFARLNALIRRELPKHSSKIEVGKFKLYLDTHHLLFLERPIYLPRKQRLILECLMIRHPQVVTRDLLISHVWEDEWTDRNTVDVQMSQLRKYLSSQIGFDPIKTMHCLGYKLVTREERVGEKISTPG